MDPNPTFSPCSPVLQSGPCASSLLPCEVCLLLGYLCFVVVEPAGFLLLSVRMGGGELHCFVSSHLGSYVCSVALIKVLNFHGSVFPTHEMRVTHSVIRIRPYREL